MSVKRLHTLGRRPGVFKIGSVVEINHRPYRIITSFGTEFVLIELGIRKYRFFRCDCMTLIDLPGIKELDDPYKSFSYMVGDDEMDLLKKKQDAVRTIIETLGPDVAELSGSRTCPGMKELLKEFGVTKKVAHTWIRRYLQSGCDIYSLRDKRKTRVRPETDMFNTPYNGGRGYRDGRKRVKIQPERERKYFEEGFRRINQGLSLALIARLLNVKYFSQVILNEDGDVVDIKELPEHESLSEKRFRRYCRERMGAVSLDKYRKGVRERINADRVRFGKAQTDCPFPGAVVEIDACEIDFIIIGEEDKIRQDLGRPVVYFAIDVFSCKIVGYYVGFENNSFLGATSLFNNMFFSGDRILPDSIRVDHGAEWISEGIRRLGKELGITVTIVPPAMGSYKGMVENSFHSYQMNLRGAGKEYGAIYKEYDSRHYDKACLMLEHIKKDIEAFIEVFNKLIRKGYELSADMVRSGVRPVPDELWAYGLKNLSIPRPITEAVEGRCLFALCVPKKTGNGCSLSQYGITVDGLTYISDDKLLLELINRKHFGTDPADFEVRIDPRTVAHIFVRIDKEVIRVPLGKKHDSLEGFSNLTWFEYLLLREDMKSDKKAYQDTDRHLRMLLAAKTWYMMDRAGKTRNLIGGKNSKKNIRGARLNAQQDDRRKNALGNAAGAAALPGDGTDKAVLPDPFTGAPGLPAPASDGPAEMPELPVPASDSPAEMPELPANAAAVCSTYTDPDEDFEKYYD